MKLALEQAQQGNSTYGCVIAEDREVLASAFNTVKKSRDVTAHAEINAIRQLNRIPDFRTRNLTLYSTAEPCTMCMGAIVYAGIHRVVFGVSIQEISHFQRQIMIPAQKIADAGFTQIEINAGILHEECLNLFKTKTYDRH